MKRRYITPCAECMGMQAAQFLAFSDFDQSSPSMGGGMGGFLDHDQDNPDIGGSPGGFWDSDM